MMPAGARLLYHPSELADWQVCRAIVRKTDEGEHVPCGYIAITQPAGPECPAGGHDAKRQPLRVEQRPLAWTEEAEIAARAALPNQRFNPAAILEGIVAFTVRKSNFGLEDGLLDRLNTEDATEQQLGWVLYKWLGGIAFVNRLTTRPQLQEEARKKSQPHSPTPASADPTPEPPAPTPSTPTPPKRSRKRASPAPDTPSTSTT